MGVATVDRNIYQALEEHVGGVFRLFEEFPTKVDFPVVGLGDVQVYDHQLMSYFENEYNPVWMVFLINGELYKIEGSKDSYGGSNWNQTFTKVKKRETVEYVYA